LSSEERAYLTARAKEERRAATNANDPRAARVHHDLAHGYDVRANIDRVRERFANDAGAPAASVRDRSSGAADPSP